jgi:hypothetical protein
LTNGNLRIVFAFEIINYIRDNNTSQEIEMLCRLMIDRRLILSGDGRSNPSAAHFVSALRFSLFDLRFPLFLSPCCHFQIVTFSYNQ